MKFYTDATQKLGHTAQTHMYYTYWNIILFKGTAF